MQILEQWIDVLLVTHPHLPKASATFCTGFDFQMAIEGSPTPSTLQQSSLEVTVSGIVKLILTSPLYSPAMTG